MPFTNWAELYFIENPGMAFGIELGGKLFLSIFRILASVALVYFLFKIRKNEAYPKKFRGLPVDGHRRSHRQRYRRNVLWIDFQ